MMAPEFVANSTRSLKVVPTIHRKGKDHEKDQDHDNVTAQALEARPSRGA
jgi:hypothetical protein